MRVMHPAWRSVHMLPRFSEMNSENIDSSNVT